MRRLVLVACLILVAGVAPATASAAVSLETVGDFVSPIHVTAAPGDPDRLFVVERAGRVKVVPNAAGVSRPAASFLDVSSAVTIAGEGGLLSIAFPPDYAASGLVYAVYTTNGGDTIRVVEARRDPGNPDATVGTPRTVLEIPHPVFRNHYGGQLHFDRLGRLYISVGDGGSAGDPSDNAQNPRVLLGKLLRIDPRASGGAPYTIPADNPFGAGGSRRELWSLGLRNPFRFSFDRTQGDLTVGDVGQGDVEEVDLVRRAQFAGAAANFGWRRCEGHLAFPVTSPPQACSFASTRPVLTRLHSQGDCSIIGGYVVRDASLEELGGRYVHGDLCPSALRSVRLGAADDAPLPGLDLQNATLVSFGEDACGRVYVVQRHVGAATDPGRISRLTDGTSSCTAASVLALPPAPPSAPRFSGPAAPPGSGGGGGATPAVDLRPPLLGLRTGRRQRVLRNRGVIVRLRCDEPCSYRVGARLNIRRGKRKIRARQRTGSLPANRTARLRLRFSTASARTLRAALRRNKRVRVRVEVRVRDRSGNLRRAGRLFGLVR